MLRKTLEIRLNTAYLWSKMVCEAFVVANIKIIEGWHINGANLPIDCYSLPTEIILAQDTLLFEDSDSIIEPAYEEIYDKVAKEMLYLHDSAITMKKKITLLSDSNFVLKGTFTFQTCDDVHCLPHFQMNSLWKYLVAVKKSGASEDNSNEIMIIIFGLISLLIISTLILRKEKHEITKEIIFFFNGHFYLTSYR